MAERGDDLAVFANPGLLRKSLTDSLSAMLLALLVLGGIAYIVRDVRPLSLFLVAACALIELWILALVIPVVGALSRDRPVLYLGRPGLWLASVGWIDREEVERLLLFRLGAHADIVEIAIMPKDRAIIRRFPLHARISAATAWWTGSVVSIPWKGLSVAGPDLLAYMQKRYGLGTTERTLDPRDLLPGA